jgi:hypothetical protein
LQPTTKHLKNYCRDARARDDAVPPVADAVDCAFVHGEAGEGTPIASMRIISSVFAYGECLDIPQ